VVDIVNSSGLRAAQLHGHESAEATRFVRSRIPVVFKAFSADDPALDRAGDFGTDAVLLDSPRPGSGETFDWALAERRAAQQRIVLAGGLTPDNVAEAIGQVGPWGVDVASGVEADRGEPGQKDARKVKAFIDAARAAVPAEHVERFAPYDWMQDDPAKDDAR
jgi:phosphoribosylanthranilate isomerase